MSLVYSIDEDRLVLIHAAGERRAWLAISPPLQNIPNTFYIPNDSLLYVQYPHPHISWIVQCHLQTLNMRHLLLNMVPPPPTLRILIRITPTDLLLILLPALDSVMM
jgi:hypothetical protein